MFWLRLSPITARAAALALACFSVAIVFSPAAVALPPNFEDVTIADDWEQAVGLTFAPDGRMFVWEKAGRVWNVENGVKAAQPLIDISDEVGNWDDYGMLGFALDPDFYTNGYIYLMYVVDYHHLMVFDTPDYDPEEDWYHNDTIGRITRYTCTAVDGYRTADLNSRLVLLGESVDAGIPICHNSHGVGSLVFGEDGMLLASCGDGASYYGTDAGGPADGSSNTALADGIIQPKEDVGVYRSQLVDSLNGKILRINPANGDGIPTNPYFDGNAPRAPRSRVWALGLRNPYRMVLRPGTGNPNAELADPGTLYLGDVGWYTWEELNICRGPGLNFGWPVFEGLELNEDYLDARAFNLEAPNPLFGSTPECNEPNFRFHDLIIQDTLSLSPFFPNPCDPSEGIPAGQLKFVHHRPAIDWNHEDEGPSRAGGYIGEDASIYEIGGIDSPVAGPQFHGSCAQAGVWYNGTNFPPEYQNTLFFHDYAGRWIRSMRVNANENPVEILDFAPVDAGAIVGMGMDPTTGSLYYINYDGSSSIHRITLVDNLSPIAVAEASPLYGPAPLSVQFSSAGSVDPEDHGISYEWDFGDGTPKSIEPNPTHVFGFEDITQEGEFTLRVDELNPPHPIGGGNWDPEVMRDDDFPPTSSTHLDRQFDTFHEGDQGSFDFVGYTFTEQKEFRKLVFQEGMNFTDGGWFDSISVDYFDGDEWQPIPDFAFAPAYAGNNEINYETYVISFPPISGTGIRISGEPGGSNKFVGFGEFHVLATPTSPITTPQAYDVTLTVRDNLNATTSASLVVSINNTPPEIEIVSPLPGSTFSAAHPTVVPLIANITDAEHGPGEYTCRWQTILHHDEHLHPDPYDLNCESSTTFFPHGSMGDVFYYEVQLLVTDDAGLSAMQSVTVVPACSPLFGDFDADDDVDAGDVTAFRTCFTDSGGGPVVPGCEAGDVEPDGDIDCDDWAEIHESYECTTAHEPPITIEEFVSTLIDDNAEAGLRCIADINADAALDGLDVEAYVEHVLHH